MRKFLSLPQEKQDRIVNSAMKLFGEVGYKKAYVSEIAAAAGISKALVFHYFGSKKDLYSYLVYYTGKIVMTEAQHERETAGKDFFERALVTIRFRLTMKSKYPAMNAFIDSVYKEDDAEVASDVERLLAIATDIHTPIALFPGEDKQFKSGASEKDIIALISGYADGIVSAFGKDSNIDEVSAGAAACLNMLKKAL